MVTFLLLLYELYFDNIISNILEPSNGYAGIKLNIKSPIFTSHPVLNIEKPLIIYKT